MPDRRRHLGLLAAALAAWLPCVAARAADVELRVSSREVYVGVPFKIILTITNAREYEPPQLLDIPGLRQLNRPQTSTRTLTFNGKTTYTVTLSYEVIAETEGQFTIPAITVILDGQEHRTATARIVAGEIPHGPADATLLSLEVKSDQDTYFLGQTIELVLQVWLLPYFDDRFTVRFDAQAMSERISVRDSQWGVFADNLRDSRVREILRTDADGVQRAYYVYFISRTISPNQAGTIAFDDIRVIVDYPTRIRRTRSLFTGPWETVDARKIAATVEHTPIAIERPPLEGRPPSFTGAVGQFTFGVTAKPREVAVGDPITLTLAIDDRSTPATDMAVLKPPALATDTTLTADFRVAGDPPAGLVDDRRKTFTQTVRARNAKVASVPAIPFSYFDPQTRTYVTVSSEPISLRVRPAATLSDTQIVGGEGAAAQPMTELEEVAGGILANYTGADLLLSSQAFAFTWGHGLALAFGPLAFGVVAVGRHRARRARRDGGHTRRRRARREALRRLAEASASPDREANLAAAAVSEYVADRCNLPPGALTTTEVVERLADGGVAPAVLKDVETLLADCEQHRYAGAMGRQANSIAERARKCLDRLERERLR